LDITRKGAVIEVSPNGCGFIFLFFRSGASAQISAPDQRYKVDLPVIVARPDDDIFVSGYLAPAIFDQHKKVAVVCCTHGDSGTNSEGREHAQALGLAREMEAPKP